jgi:hypothetical protein
VTSAPDTSQDAACGEMGWDAIILLSGLLPTPLCTLFDAEQTLVHHREVADLHEDQVGHDGGPGPPVVALQPDKAIIQHDLPPKKWLEHEACNV